MINALNVIQSLVSKGENTQVNQYINKLSKLMRMVLKRSESGLQDIIAELEKIQDSIRILDTSSSGGYGEIKIKGYHDRFSMDILVINSQ